MILPSTRYHPQHPPVHVHTEEEHDALAARGWVETPADFPDDDATKDAPLAPAPKRKR